MEKFKKITYLAIPDESCYMVNMDDYNGFSINDVNENTTCVCFIDKDATHNKQIAELVNDIKSHYMKVAWFTEKQVIPFRAEIFDYVKTGDTLYLNITDSKNPKYIDITNKLVKCKKDLDPLMVFYFEMFDELESLKISCDIDDYIEQPDISKDMETVDGSVNIREVIQEIYKNK